MAKVEARSRGRDLADRLRRACAAVVKALRPGARDLPRLKGLTPGGVFLEPLENVRHKATEILADGGRVYAYGEDVVYEVVGRSGRRLVTLARGDAVESCAASVLTNEFVCEHAAAGKEPFWFAPRPSFIALLLNSSPLRAALPSIRTYAARPVFDDGFCLLGPGWHPGPDVLVHGPEVEPIEPPDPDPERPIADRLPPHLRTLLANFCFREPADVANVVAAMITALLVNHFVATGKPVVLFDGNQPGLGKTLLGRILGILLDGADPAPIHFSPDDEELGKRICSTLRGGGQSLVLIDNAKVRGGDAIDSRVVEAISMAPRVSLRILGASENYTRPNDLIWAITMNGTKTSPDLVSRGLPVRLRYDGDPRRREFSGPDPIAYAIEHRAELLGELAGMVVRWNRLGRPEFGHEHRCGPWARTIGGILHACGLVEFLTNLDEAAASFNQLLDELAALAEAALSAKSPAAVIIEPRSEGGYRPENPPAKKGVTGLTPTEWEGLFRTAGVQAEALDNANYPRARATKLGQFLSQHIDRVVPILAGERQGTARLRVADAGKRQRRYYFEIAWEGEALRDELAERGPDAADGPRCDVPARSRRDRGRRQARAGRTTKPSAATSVVRAPGRDGRGNTEDWS